MMNDKIWFQHDFNETRLLFCFNKLISSHHFIGVSMLIRESERLRDIDLACFYDFSIRFRNCSDNVVFFFPVYYMFMSEWVVVI